MTAFVISVLPRLLHRVCVRSLDFLPRGLFFLSEPRRPLRALWPMAAQDHQARVRFDGCFDGIFDVIRAMCNRPKEIICGFQFEDSGHSKSDIGPK